MSIFDSIVKQPVVRVLGIDCSTKSLAYACFEGDTPLYCGEVFFVGATVFERLADAQAKLTAILNSESHMDTDGFRADYVAIEAAIAVQNPQTVIQLAYVYGACMGVLMKNGAKVVTVPPITWQTAIGNPNLKKPEKEQIKLDNPGRKPSWYQNEGRKIRKSRTLDFAKKFFNIKSNSDNIGDAVGIAWYAANKMTRT
jgi:Holliday junction resolvasome RuvABC endonuclease subunit